MKKQVTETIKIKTVSELEDIPGRIGVQAVLSITRYIYINNLLVAAYRKPVSNANINVKDPVKDLEDYLSTIQYSENIKNVGAYRTDKVRFFKKVWFMQRNKKKLDKIFSNMNKSRGIKSQKANKQTPRFLRFLQSFYAGLLKRFFPPHPEVLFLRFPNEYSEVEDIHWKYQIKYSLAVGFRLRGIKRLTKSSTEYMGVVKVYYEGKLIFHRYLTRPEVDWNRSFFRLGELVEKGVLRSSNFRRGVRGVILLPGDDYPFFYGY
jgi:hypothetical protein